MRKIVAGLFLSLDGVYEAPHEWHFPYFDDEMGKAVDEQIAATDTMLLGRKTYEEFASFWPQQSAEEIDIATHMNETPKLVVSNTLTSLDWQNSTLISGDVNAQLREYKQQLGKNIGTTGSGTLVRTLLRDGLLDELRLFVHPIVVGSGKKRLFTDDYEQQGLKLLDSQTFGTGTLYLTYGSADATDD